MLEGFLDCASCASSDPEDFVALVQTSDATEQRGDATLAHFTKISSAVALQIISG